MRFYNVLYLLTCASLSCGLKILGLFPYPGKSHFDVFRPLLRSLADRGHELTVVSYFPQSDLPKNYKDIDLSGYNQEETVEVVDMGLIQKIYFSNYLTPILLAVMGKEACAKVLPMPPVQELIRSKQTFDLIITEYFNTDCFVAFARKFDAPIVAVSSCILLPWSYEKFGLPDNPAYVPNHFLAHNDRMSFMERVQNTVFYLYSKAITEFLVKRESNILAKKYFGEDLLDLDEISRNYSRMFIVNTHFSINLPKPVPPTFVEVGGLHIGSPKKLPKNIEKWINESTHGVIYFSLGSMIKGHTFPEEKRQIFLRAFARLPQRVLWKWENDTMPGKPDNVMTQKWMPQFDILCHPNVRAFISHGGLLGTTEAVHCGVPAIVMPQFGDQYTNAKAWEANGGAVIMELGSVTDERLQEALQKVLDPKFREQAKELSARYRDRPMSPLDTAIYWVEYVARHKGAPFLRTAAVGMPFYKYLLLDVIAFLLLVLAVIVYVNYLFWRMILRKLFGKGQKVKTN